MTARKFAPLPPINVPWVDGQGRPMDSFRNYMVALAAGNLGPLASAANDAEAKAAGVPVNGLYEASGVVRIRKA